MGRENQQACLYTAQKGKAIHSLEFWSSNENSRQHWRRSAGIGKILFERVLWPITENETFLWIYGMFEQMKFCGGFIISILMGITCDEGPLCIPDLRQIYLY